MDKELTAAIVAAVQLELSRKGFYHGGIDGDAGPKTAAAFIAFKARHGWRARATPLLQTIPLLFSREALAALPADSAPRDEGTPPLLAGMRALLGTKEAPGTANNPRIIELARKGGVTWYSADSTAWCAITVNGVLAECGYPTTASALAKSFVNDGYGREIAPADIAPGDIIVFDRGNVAWQGHVEVVDKVNGDGTVWAIGGNVGDQVKRTRRKIADIVPRGIRRPVMAGA